MYSLAIVWARSSRGLWMQGACAPRTEVRGEKLGGLECGLAGWRGAYYQPLYSAEYIVPALDSTMLWKQ